MLSDYTKEQNELKEQQDATMFALSERTCTERDITEWLDLISGYMELETLDRITVLELIDYIEIGERQRDDRKREIDISIRYRFIGNLLDDTKEDIA